MAEQTFRSPGFFDREIDLSQRQTSPSGIPAGVIGTAEMGPAFVPVTVGDFGDFQTRFGTLQPGKFGPYAVREFLKNRQACTFMRVLGTGLNKTTAQIENFEKSRGSSPRYYLGVTLHLLKKPFDLWCFSVSETFSEQFCCRSYGNAIPAAGMAFLYLRQPKTQKSWPTKLFSKQIYHFPTKC